MNKEEGVVTRIDSNTAWVKTQKTGDCESCSTKGFCSSLGGGKAMEIEAVNVMGAHEGDRVVIGCEASSVVKISFLIYIFPIICLVIGAVIGQQTAPNFSFDPSLFSAGLGFAFLVVSFLLVRLIGNKLSQDDRYRPKIIRIL